MTSEAGTNASEGGSSGRSRSCRRSSNLTSISAQIAIERALEIDEINDHAVPPASNRKTGSRRRRTAEARIRSRRASGQPLTAGRRCIAAGRLRSARASGRGTRRSLRATTVFRARAGEAPPRAATARALVGWIEDADGLDQVVEEVEPERLRRAGGEQVHDRSAHCEFARAQDLSDLHVTGVDESLAQLRQVDAFAGSERKGMCRDECSRRQAVEQRGLRRDDDAVAQFRGGPQACATAPRRCRGAERRDRKASVSRSGK